MCMLGDQASSFIRQKVSFSFLILLLKDRGRLLGFLGVGLETFQLAISVSHWELNSKILSGMEFLIGSVRSWYD